MLDVNNVPQDTEGSADNSGAAKIRVVFTLRPELDREIEIAAAKLNTTKSQLVHDAVVAYLGNRG